MTKDWTFAGTWPHPPQWFDTADACTTSTWGHAADARSRWSPTTGAAPSRCAFLADFPAAEVLEVPEAGHFIQEDAHEVVVPALLAFLADR